MCNGTFRAPFKNCLGRIKTQKIEIAHWDNIKIILLGLFTKQPILVDFVFGIGLTNICIAMSGQWSAWEDMAWSLEDLNEF